MSEKVKKLIGLQDVLRLELKIGVNIYGKFYVSFNMADVKINHYILEGAYGVGDTIDKACEDYFNQISGKTLVYYVEETTPAKVTERIRKEVVII